MAMTRDENGFQQMIHNVPHRIFSNASPVNYEQHYVSVLFEMCFSLAFCHIFLWFLSVFALISWKYRTFMMWITWHCSEKMFVCMQKLDSTQARCQRWLHKFDYVSLWCLVESDFFLKKWTQCKLNWVEWRQFELPKHLSVSDFECSL